MANISPTGKKSKLNPAQWKEVRTPEFITWFGDWLKQPSKYVLDQDTLEPIIFYHGTNVPFGPGFENELKTPDTLSKEERKKFDMNYPKGSEPVLFFSKNPDVAFQFGPGIVPVYLKMTKPNKVVWRNLSKTSSTTSEKIHITHQNMTRLQKYLKLAETLLNETDWNKSIPKQRLKQLQDLIINNGNEEIFAKKVSNDDLKTELVRVLEIIQDNFSSKFDEETNQVKRLLYYHREVMMDLIVQSKEKGYDSIVVSNIADIGTFYDSELAGEIQKWFRLMRLTGTPVQQERVKHFEKWMKGLRTMAKDTQYIVFHSSQVKSAIGNKGSFKIDSNRMDESR